MENKNKVIQATKFGLIAYDDSLPKSIKDILTDIGVMEYAYILHDCDIDENGVPKKPHYHIYFKSISRKTIGKIAKLFNVAENLVEIIKEPNAFIRYFTHIDYEEKYQYNSEYIITNLDISHLFTLGEWSDEDFIIYIIELINSKDISQFNDIVSLSMLPQFNKLKLVMNKSYFFNCLLR